MAEIEVRLGPAPKEGLPVATIRCGKKKRGMVYFDEYGLKIAGFFYRGIWPFRTSIMALAMVCGANDENHDGEPDRAMRHCHLPPESKPTVLRAIAELHPVCPVREKCQVKGCWSGLGSG